MWLLAMVLAAVCIETAAADSIIPPEVSEAVPPEAAQMMEEIGDAPEQSLWQGLRKLWTAARDYGAQALHQRLSGAVVLLGVGDKWMSTAIQWTYELFCRVVGF